MADREAIRRVVSEKTGRRPARRPGAKIVVIHLEYVEGTDSVKRAKLMDGDKQVAASTGPQSVVDLKALIERRPDLELGGVQEGLA